MNNPIHAIVKRIGTSAMRKFVWDREFAAGRWLSDPGKQIPDVCLLIDKYLTPGGALLDLGCSNGIVACRQGKYGRYIGVDISEIAIDSARKRMQDKCEWYCSDIASFETPVSDIDVVLFRGSIYYLTGSEIKSVLQRYCRKLSPTGVIIVIMDNPVRHQWITNIIMKNYNVLECNEGKNIQLVFNGRRQNNFARPPWDILP